MIAGAKAKVLMLDDDESFLDVATYYLEKKFENSVHISKFNSSDNFLFHIHNNCFLPESAQDIIRSFYSAEKTPVTIERTLQDLSELPAILIIDHQLRNESITGIEIAEKVREYVLCPFTILLTSHIDTKSALRLHNNETIDLFVRKDDLNSMEYIYSHIKKQIHKQYADCSINPEDAFEFETVLEDDIYIAKKSELLNELEYQSYLTISNQGEIAVLDLNHQIKTYHYQNQAFNLHG